MTINIYTTTVSVTVVDDKKFKLKDSIYGEYNISKVSFFHSMIKC